MHAIERCRSVLSALPCGDVLGVESHSTIEVEFDQMDFIRLANYRAYVKLMIDGTPSKPFSAITLRTV